MARRIETQLDLAGNRILSLGSPVASTDAVNKAYVDASIQGMDIKASCRLSSTTSVTFTYSATGGTSGRGQITAAPSSLDGTALAANDRILLKDQTTGAQNGIYTVTTVGTGGNGVWDRATDFDSDAEVTAGAFTFITEGSQNSDTGWVLITNDPITIGGASGTSLVFSQFTGAGEVVAGAGLTKTGNTLDIVSANTGRIVVNADSIDLATVGTAGTYGRVTVDAYGRITSGSEAATLTTNDANSYLTGGNYNGSAAITLAVDATTSATASKIVARDGSGNINGNIFNGTGFATAGSTSTSKLTLIGGVSASLLNLGTSIHVSSATHTDTVATGLVARVNANFLGTPTFAASNSITVASAATLMITAAPVAGTNVSISSSQAISVVTGDISAWGGNLGTGKSGSNGAALLAKLHLNAGNNNNYSRTNWANNGSQITVSPVVVTDTDSSGTVIEHSNYFGAITTASSSAITITVSGNLAAVNPKAGTNTTITNSVIFYGGTSSITGTVTNSYGLYLETASGATNNYGAYIQGFVGLNTDTPGSQLDVKGTLRLSGSTSGFVGFSPAAAAGSITYTLPSADGTSGQFLSTNGSGTLSWATASGGGSTSIGSTISGGTAGSVLFLGASSVLAQDNANLYYDSTNKRLGFGTASPITVLDIVTTRSVDTPSFNGIILSVRNGTLTDTSTAAPTTNVHPNFIGQIVYTSTNAQSPSTAASFFIGGAVRAGNNASITDSYGLFVNSQTSVASGGSVTNAYGIYVQAPTGATNNYAGYFGGNVGINTTAPGSALDVKGALRLSGATSGFVGFSPAASAGSTTYTLPTADGSNTHVLTTNGAGVLSWAAASATVSIGGTVTSGTANNILFINPTATLAQSANFTFTSSTNVLSISGSEVITSTSATALAVGRQGSTTPVLNVEASQASQATGINIRGFAAGSGVTIQTTSSGTNENLTLASKGTGSLLFQVNAANRYIITGTSGTTHTWSTAAASTGATSSFVFSGASDTGLTASTEVNIFKADFSALTKQHATGALATQRDFFIKGGTDSFVAASTLTLSASLGVGHKTGAGTNATVTNTAAIYVPGDTISGTVTNSYGIYILPAASGGTNRYAAYLGGRVGIGSGLTAPTATLHLAAGSTTAGSAPAKLTSSTGNVLATAETGAIEYDGTNLFFTRTGTTRESVFVGNSGATAPANVVGAAPTSYIGASNTQYLGNPNSWASVVVGGTTYKIPLYT